MESFRHPVVADSSQAIALAWTLTFGRTLPAILDMVLSARVRVFLQFVMLSGNGIVD